MFARPALLHLGKSWLDVMLPSHGQLERTIRFSLSDDPTCADFAHWLNTRAESKNWRILIDLDDESHFTEELPCLRGKDGRTLLARRLQHWFDDPSLAHARLIERSADKRQRMLFAGLNRPQRLQPVLQTLNRSGAHIEALVAASTLLAHYCRHTVANTASANSRLSPWQRKHPAQPAAALLILSIGAETIRFSLADRGLPRLARTLAADRQTDEVCTELARTLDYARDLLAKEKTALQLQSCLLVHPDQLQQWQQALNDAGLTHFALSFEPAAKPALHTSRGSATHDADPVLAPVAHSIDLLLLHWLQQCSHRLLRELSWPCPRERQTTSLSRRKPLYAVASTLAAGVSLPLTLSPSDPGVLSVRPPFLHRLAPAANGIEIPLPSIPDEEERGNESFEPALPSAPAAPPVANTVLRISGLLRSPHGHTVVWLDGRPHSLPTALHLAPYPALELEHDASSSPPATPVRVHLRAGDDWFIDPATAASIQLTTTAGNKP